MTPEMLEAIPHSIPKRAGTLYALSYFSDGDDGCRYGTLSVSQDVGVLLRAMLDDMKRKGTEVVLSHVWGGKRNTPSALRQVNRRQRICISTIPSR